MGLRENTRVRLSSRGADRFGFVERETLTGAIVRLDDGSSAFVSAVRRYNPGECMNYGLFYVQTVSER